MDAIEDLNLRFGLMHQDISPRNILVDSLTGNLKIFDFDRSARIGSPGKVRNLNDVDGLIFTIYETLTKDKSYRNALFGEDQVQKVEALEEWKLDKVPLEEEKGGITAYGHFLGKWVHGRRTTRRIEHYSQATEPLSWPEYKEPELIPMFLDVCPTGVPRRRR